MSNYLLKPILLTLLVIYCFSSSAQYDEKLRKDRSYYFNIPPQPKQKQFYFRLGSGIATYYKSDHRDMQNFRIPLSFQIEVESNKLPFSVVANTNLLTQFYLDDFVFAPSAATVSLKYSLAYLMGKPSKIDFFVLGGIGGWYAYLTDIEYAQVKAYSYKSETDLGIGVTGGGGLSYRYFDFDFGLQYMYFYGKAHFIAGYFDPQNFYIGSHQLLFTVSYKFWINKTKYKCPSYRKSAPR